MEWQEGDRAAGKTFHYVWVTNLSNRASLATMEKGNGMGRE